MNMYGVPGPLKTDLHGWRCDHGHTLMNPCKQCGLKYPIQYIKHWWASQ